MKGRELLLLINIIMIIECLFSQEIRESSLGYMAEENEENIRKECMSKVKVMLMKMQK